MLPIGNIEHFDVSIRAMLATCFGAAPRSILSARGIRFFDPEHALMSIFKVTLACSAALILVPSAAFAQEKERYFDGPYLSGTAGLESPADSSRDAFVFDDDGDGDFDDTVRTDTGDVSFGPGFCSGAATSTTMTCRGNRSDEGYAVRVGYDRHLGAGPFVAGILVEGARPGAEEITSGYTIAPDPTPSAARSIGPSPGARASVSLPATGAACSTRPAGQVSPASSPPLPQAMRSTSSRNPANGNVNSAGRAAAAQKSC